METLRQPQDSFLRMISEIGDREWVEKLLHEPEIQSLIVWFSEKGGRAQEYCEILIQKIIDQALESGYHQNKRPHTYTVVVENIVNSLSELKHWVLLQESVKGIVNAGQDKEKE